jgi:dipeptidyl-peptidase 4
MKITNKFFMYGKFFIISLLLLTSCYLSFSQEKRKVTLEDLLKDYRFVSQSIDDLASMRDGEHYTRLENGDDIIVKYHYASGDIADTLFRADKVTGDTITRIYGYEFSRDEKKILLYTNKKSIYRHSFIADYYVYDIDKNLLLPVSKNGKQQVASFSPDGTKVAFVRENNIFIKDITSGLEEQITNDGKHNHIINGIPDWVYEEEFAFEKAWQWSPNGRFLTYMKFNETEVPEYHLKMYKGMAPSHKKNIIYPEIVSYKYPKAGEKNSIVTIHIYNVKTGETLKVETGEKTDQYIPRLRWPENLDSPVFYRLNRRQDTLEILLANPESGQTKVIYQEANDYYIDETNFDYVTFLPDKEHFVVLSEKSGYLHLYLFNMEGEEVRRLTSGNHDVTEFYGYDKKKKVFYYQSAEESPVQRGIYSVSFNARKKKKLHKARGFNEAMFSANYKYMIHTFSNARTPPVITIENTKGKIFRTITSNKGLKEELTRYEYSDKTFFRFKTNEGIELNGWMIRPPDFDSVNQYPVVIRQYSGPNSQVVLDEWSFNWTQAFAAKGYIIVGIDPRGTGARGEEFRKSTYLQLGKYETTDLIETAKYLGNQAYIDKERIGIWGWSYGGFTTLLCMTKGADYFNTGIAIAPVTNWRFYDNIYTERFMRKPSENMSGYEDNSPLNFAHLLKGNLLICHGTADDNVHPQNTMEMTERLVQANKDFRMHLYTNRNHSIYGGNTRYHLFKMCLDFFTENL